MVVCVRREDMLCVVCDAVFCVCVCVCDVRERWKIDSSTKTKNFFTHHSFNTILLLLISFTSLTSLHTSHTYLYIYTVHLFTRRIFFAARTHTLIRSIDTKSQYHSYIWLYCSGRISKRILKSYCWNNKSRDGSFTSKAATKNDEIFPAGFQIQSTIQGTFLHFMSYCTLILHKHKI